MFHIIEMYLKWEWTEEKKGGKCCSCVWLVEIITFHKNFPKTGHQLDFQTYQLLYLYQAHFQFRCYFLGVGEMSPNDPNLVSLSCSIQDIHRASQLSEID